MNATPATTDDDLSPGTQPPHDMRDMPQDVLCDRAPELGYCLPGFSSNGGTSRGAVPAPLPPDEEERLAALHRYAIIDTAPEQAYDDITLLASQICQTPIGLVSFVDEKRQWFKSKIGINESETSRDVSFCAHGILQNELFVVRDTLEDERFASNPMVTGNQKIRFYAGSQLTTADGHVVGMLCVKDRVPRDLSQEQKNALLALGRQVVAQLESRRRADDLRTSEERLRIVTDNARVGLVIVNMDRRYIYANGAYSEILDLPSALVGRRVADVLPDIYEKQICPRLDRAFRGERISYELSKPVTGGEGHYEIRYEPTLIGGKVSLVVVVITDVSERKRAEMASRRLSAIVEFSEDAIIGKDLNSTITSWNRGAERIFGYTEKEIVGSSILRLIPEDRHSDEDHILGKIRQGESVEHFETLRQTKTGKLIHVSVTASPIKDALGQVIGVSKVLRDITKRKRDAEQIAEQAALLDKTRDAVIVHDLQGKILFWNKGAERMYGWSSQEVAGHNVGALLHSRLETFDEANTATISKGDWSGELHHLAKNRGEIVTEARWTLIRDNEGQPKSVLAINTDITERKSIEAQFMRAQRMESIGTLAGGIAHDLNNILAPIMMSIDILKSMSEEQVISDILNTLEISAKRGADIVRQVLSFARGMEGERIEVQPKHLLKDLGSIIKDTFPKDIRLQFSIPNDTWTILGDPTQIHQVLLNLSVNARDAMPNGGELKFGIENCLLDEHYATMYTQANPGRYVIITVSDSGVGIAPSLLDKIFEPFFTTKEFNKGTGLGLSTVMAIVKSHNGFVNVYSELGNGTEFKVYLPASKSTCDATAPQPTSVPLARGHGEMILIVDDETSIVAITRQTLQAYGYRVLTATDGADAVASYAQHHKEIAAVLTDMMMPIMDGPALAQVLRRMNPEVKIIATSGLNATGTTERAAASGIKHFLTKPYTAGTLLSAMRAILDEA